MRVRFTWDGDALQRLNDVLDGMSLRVDELRPLAAQLGERFRAYQRRMFATGGRSAGLDWQPLSPGYARRVGRTRPFANSRSALVRSLTQQRARGARERVRRNEIFIGTVAPHATLHQTGGRPGGLPSRPLVHLTRAEQRAWVDIVADYVTGKHSDRLGL